MACATLRECRSCREEDPAGWDPATIRSWDAAACRGGALARPEWQPRLSESAGDPELRNGRFRMQKANNAYFDDIALRFVKR